MVKNRPASPFYLFFPTVSAKATARAIIHKMAITIQKHIHFNLRALVACFLATTSSLLPASVFCRTVVVCCSTCIMGASCKTTASAKSEKSWLSSVRVRFICWISLCLALTAPSTLFAAPVRLDLNCEKLLAWSKI